MKKTLRDSCCYAGERLTEQAMTLARQVSFGELLARSLDDFTLRVLLAAGALSLVLEAALGADAGGWVEGAAILAAVAVVALVTATNDFQKERQFRALSALSSAADVRSMFPDKPKPCSTHPSAAGCETEMWERH